MKNAMRVRKTKRGKRQSGMSLIEVMFAGFILSVGMLALMGLVVTAIAANTRNRADSTATMVAQAAMEQIEASLVGTGTSSITDCAGNTWVISSTVGGATTSSGVIDWSQAYSSIPGSMACPGGGSTCGYKMKFVVCTNSVQSTYDVRWKISMKGNSYYVVIGARPVNSPLAPTGTTDKNALRYFAMPVNLRALVGP